MVYPSTGQLLITNVQRLALLFWHNVRLHYTIQSLTAAYDKNHT